MPSNVIPVELMLGGYGEQLPALRDGRADVALVTTPFDGRGLDSEPLITGPRLVAIAASDPLAARSDLQLADLAGAASSLRHTGREGPSKPPFDHHEPLDHSQILNLTELGSTVWFLPSRLAERFARPGIAYLPVEGLEPATLTIARPARCPRSATVAAFVRTLQQIASETAPYGPVPMTHPA